MNGLLPPRPGINGSMADVVKGTVKSSSDSNYSESGKETKSKNVHSDNAGKTVVVNTSSSFNSSSKPSTSSKTD